MYPSDIAIAWLNLVRFTWSYQLFMIQARERWAWPCSFINVNKRFSLLSTYECFSNGKLGRNVMYPSISFSFFLLNLRSVTLTLCDRNSRQPRPRKMLQPRRAKPRVAVEGRSDEKVQARLEAVMTSTYKPLSTNRFDKPKWRLQEETLCIDRKTLTNFWGRKKNTE